MLLREIGLRNFRNYLDREFHLSESVTVFVGGNAVGKTNVLEAIRLLSVGDSFKASKIDQMVQFGEDFGRVEGLVLADDGDDKLTVILTRGEMDGKRVAKRRFLVNDVGKRKADFAGRLTSVVFRPEDLELIGGSPSLRRRWMDAVLMQVGSEYARSLGAYEKALRRRNRVLEAMREGDATRHQLTFWDGLVVRHGQVLTEHRIELINFVNEIFRRSEMFDKLEVEYDGSVISESRLAQYEKEEVLAGHTLVGPHKDDLIIRDGKRDLGVYGSRGEQRMAVLGLKMGELLFLEERLGHKPMLLLDDIFSELDEEHGSEVHRVMKGRQVVVTTTNEGDIEGLKSLVIRLKE